MTKEERKKTLMGMKDSVYGKALREELEEHYAFIGNVMNTESWEETLGRKFSLKVLKGIFSFLDNKPHTGQQKNQYE